jgi:hypothetical protein
MLPISVFRAITSHHLYEIDQIISRTFAYGALTAILAGVYTASVRLFNWVFVAVTGQESEAALVITTLILATTFTPIKTRLERFAGERFKPAPAGAAGASTGDPSSSATATALTPAAAPVLDDGLDARIDARLDSQVDARVDARLEERLGAIVRRAVDDALRERDAGSPR